MAETTMVEAIRLAMKEEMERDGSVVVLGEDVGEYGGAFKATEGLFQQFGEMRVIDMPISESAIIGVALGMGIMGFRPIAEIQFADFITCGFDQIVNQTATLRYRTEDDYVVPIGKANVLAEGDDVTVITYGSMALHCKSAIEKLDDLSVELIDLRTIMPLDKETIYRSIKKTNRTVLVYEDHKTLGIGAEIAALLAEELFEYLDAPILRVAAPDTPIPYSPPLEEFYLPGEDEIIAAINRVIEY